MAVIESSVFIQRRPEDVFDYLVDLRNELEWNPGVESMKKLTDGPVAVGTRYRAKWKQSKHVDVECTEFDRPRRWVYVNGGPVSVTLTIELTPEGNGTRLASTFDAHPHGLMLLGLPIFLRMMKRQEHENMTSLKAKLEEQVVKRDHR